MDDSMRAQLTHAFVVRIGERTEKMYKTGKQTKKKIRRKQVGIFYKDIFVPINKEKKRNIYGFKKRPGENTEGRFEKKIFFYSLVTAPICMHSHEKRIH